MAVAYTLPYYMRCISVLSIFFSHFFPVIRNFEPFFFFGNSVRRFVWVRSPHVYTNSMKNQTAKVMLTSDTSFEPDIQSRANCKDIFLSASLSVTIRLNTMYEVSLEKNNCMRKTKTNISEYV